MYVIVLAGGIASGKSTVARELRSRGAACVDLDQLSREVAEAGSVTNERIAEEFGEQMLDEAGALRRGVLAQYVFGSAERTARLEAIMHPAIRARLKEWLREQGHNALCVVEVPLLDRVEDLADTADEVVCVLCPLDTRRDRAIERGMMGSDFDARVKRQPADEYLASKADTVFANGGDECELIQKIDAWWEERRKTRKEFDAATHVGLDG